MLLKKMFYGFLLLTHQSRFYLVTMLCMQQNCNDSKICVMQTGLRAQYEKKALSYLSS